MQRYVRSKNQCQNVLGISDVKLNKCQYGNMTGMILMMFVFSYILIKKWMSCGSKLKKDKLVFSLFYSIYCLKGKTQQEIFQYRNHIVDISLKILLKWDIIYFKSELKKKLQINQATYKLICLVQVI